jgi:hypothetical protein
MKKTKKFPPLKKVLLFPLPPFLHVHMAHVQIINDDIYVTLLLSYPYLKERIGVGEAVANVDEEVLLVGWLLALLHKGGVLHQPDPDHKKQRFMSPSRSWRVRYFSENPDWGDPVF